MPVFETVTDLACPIPIAFDFLIRPANLLKVSPPDFHAELLDGPERLSLGARITVRVRRLGLPQTMVSEITAFVAHESFTDTLVKGPLPRFVHTHRLEARAGGGCRMTDRIEYEPPGGLLGLMMTAKKMEAELHATFAYRVARFHEHLGRPAASA